MMPEWIFFEIRIIDLNKKKIQRKIIRLKYSKIKFHSQDI